MLRFRKANLGDVDLYFNWANDPDTRENSYNSGAIDYDTHVMWFNKKVNSLDAALYVFMNEEGHPIGQVRIDSAGVGNDHVIGISVDRQFRGKGYATEMIKMAAEDFLIKNNHARIIANIFKRNEISFKSFTKAGFKLLNEADINNIPSYILYKNR